MSPVSGCACCLSAVEPGPRGVAYCPSCVRHQRLYTVAVLLLVGASWRLSPEVVDFVFAQLPFASVWRHATLVFVLGMVPMLGAIGIVSILSVGATHGHWGSAILQRSDSVLFRNGTYGRQLAMQLSRTCHEVKEPRSGWVTLLLLCIVMPGVFAGLAALTHHDRSFLLYVDNATSMDLLIEVEGVSLGRAEVGSSSFRLPRSSTIVLAKSRDGTVVERLSVGDLDGILAGRYAEMFPDIEHDVGDAFVWNVLSKRCYEQSRKIYGMGFGGADEPTIHNKKAFVVTAEEPFVHAPASIESIVPMGSRAQLLRSPCE